MILAAILTVALTWLAIGLALGIFIGKAIRWTDTPDDRPVKRRAV